MFSVLGALALLSQAPGLTLSGRAVGPKGEPVPAHVVVGCQAVIPFEPFEALAVARAGSDGRFSLELPGVWIEREVGYRVLHAFATLGGRGIARQSWPVAEVPVGFEPVFRLPPAARTRLRFVDRGGRPLAGARVWPQALVDPERGEFRMPNAWWREHAPRTDADGWASFPVRREELQRVALESEELGLQNAARHWETRSPLPDELELVRPLERSIRVERPAPLGALVEVTQFALRELQGGGKYVAQFEWRGELAGELSAVRAPAGHLTVRITSADAAALAFGPTRPVEEEAARDPAFTGVLEIPRPETYRVRGRTVNAEDGTPVAGAKILVHAFHKGWVTSAADGRFEFDCGAPGFSLGTLLAPPGFASEQFLDGFRGRRREGDGDVELGDVPVVPAWTAAGVVLAPDGARLTGAWVVGEQSVPSGNRTTRVTLSAVSDAAGAYSLSGAHAGQALEVTARLGELSARSTQEPGSALTLATERALSARGALRDAAGAPFAGVALEVWRESPPNLIGGEERVPLGGSDAFRTEADGSFASAGGLDPDAKYCLAWSGPGIVDGRSDWLTGAELAAGVELVAKRLGVVRGVIRGADGAPLAGVEVRLRRGGEPRATDANGAFELAGVPPDGDALIARDPDGATQVRWVAPADAELDWRLLPHGPDNALSAAPAHERARELVLAFELLEARYREAVESRDESKLLRAVRNLAWVDPALVLERVEAGLFRTAWMRDFSLAYVADALLPASPEESLTVSLRLDRGMSRALSMLDAAERLNPVAEREQLALVRAEARAIDPPEHRLVVLAHLADRLLDLGERESAEVVLAEGREVAEALPAEDWPGYARSRFGEVLARVDPEAGRALIDELASADDRPRHLFNSAQELAASDPAAAEALMADAASKRSSWRANRYAARVAYRMAPVDLERARRLARRYDRSGFADGMIALALAEEDPAEARASLETAFARAEELARRADIQFGERPVSSAAALLPVAERVAPDALRGCIARAVAIPRPSSRRDFGGDDVVWREDATLAFYVARWQPELAKELLRPAVEAARKLQGLELGSEYDAVWAALAAVDPEWAAQVARELGGRAAAEVGLVLALPPIERTPYVQDEIFGIWIVGKEDL